MSIFSKIGHAIQKVAHDAKDEIEKEVKGVVKGISPSGINLTGEVSKVFDEEVPQVLINVIKNDAKWIEGIVIDATATLIKPVAQTALQTALQMYYYVPPAYFDLKLGAVGLGFNNVQNELDKLKDYAINFPTTAAGAAKMVEDLAPDNCWLELAAEVPIIKLGADFKIGMTKEQLIAEIQKLGD